MKKLLAIASAFVLVIAVLLGLNVVLPAQNQVDNTKEYGYVASGTKSESSAFSLAAAHDDTYFLFGSSELSTTPEMVSSVPDNVFQEYDCGISFSYIGDAYNQSLWHTIAAGAYAQEMPNKKIGLIVSPQWFEDGGLEPGIFEMRFSYSLYQQFCSNPSISDSTKEYVCNRLNQEGVDRSVIDAGSANSAIDVVNDAVFSVMDDLKIRNDLREIRSGGMPYVEPNQKKSPDFDAIKSMALAQAEQSCTNNAYRVNDGYWTTYLEPNYEGLKDSQVEESLTQTPEYDDLRAFMQLCEECGLEPYIIISPVHGSWYDYVGLDNQARNDYYSAVKSICESYDVSYLDLSPYEYEPYYLRDIMHLGWLAWPEIEQGFMEFAKEN
ncbi:MAG: D-alanyl-lipoteichoic acid biosynthesis protein DltD [Raoultibacter sp.]|jgi:D-alanine transfer protein